MFRKMLSHLRKKKQKQNNRKKENVRINFETRTVKSCLLCRVYFFFKVHKLLLLKRTPRIDAFYAQKRTNERN